MMPELKILSISIPMYALMSVIGVLVVGFLACRKCKKYNIDDNDMIIMLLIAAIGVIIGGHLLYGITNINKLILVFNNLDKIDSFKVFFGCMSEIFGGQVFYGGLIGGIISAYLYLKITKKDIITFIYIITPYIPLFHMFGRIGCFLGGCCYGIEMHPGITFHNSPLESANDVSRLPIQLIEAGCNFILFLVLLKLQNKGKAKDILLPIYLLSYSIIRFIDEFFRGDDYRGFIGSLSTSQIISILLFIFSIILIMVIKRKSNKENNYK